MRSKSVSPYFCSSLTEMSSSNPLAKPHVHGSFRMELASVFLAGMGLIVPQLVEWAREGGRVGYHWRPFGINRFLRLIIAQLPRARTAIGCTSVVFLDVHSFPEIVGPWQFDVLQRRVAH